MVAHVGDLFIGLAVADMPRVGHRAKAGRKLVFRPAAVEIAGNAAL